MPLKTFNFSEWAKKKKEEEEKKAQLTQQEKAMGGISDDNTELQGFNFSEWAKRRLAEANEETYAPVPPAAEYVARTTGVMPSVVDVVNDDVYTGQEATWTKNAKGNVAQQILGTVGDTALGLVTGFGEFNESIYDLGVLGISHAADALGADEVAEKLRQHAEDEWMRDWAKDKVDYVDQYSVLGEKSDTLGETVGGALAQATWGRLGQYASIIASGLSSAGSGVVEAYKNDATHEQAWAYGLGKGVSGALIEGVSGGLGKGFKALGVARGIGGLDDMFAKKAANVFFKAISNETVQKVLGNTAEAAIKAGGEALEEFASAHMGAFLQWLTYRSDEDLKTLIKDSNALESAMYGFLTSGIMQGADVIKSTANKTDFVTGHTTSEEKVIQRAAEQEIAKREANGEKLTKKQKNEIYDRLTEDISRGYISIDTIEEALGGDKYTEYKKASDENDALKKELDELRTLSEYDSLRNMKSGDRTDIQNDRLAELKGKNLSDMTEEQKSRLAELETKYGENTKTLEDMKKQMSDDVLNLVKSDRKGQGSLLMESYNEKTRRGEGYTIDLKTIDSKKQDTYKRAMDAGILNNTNRTHDFVDLIATLESERGVKIDFVNNQKIKESGFAVDGAIVNGVKTDNGILLNVESGKTLDTVVGHEIAHVLEGTELYSALQDSIIKYAQSKGDYDTRYANIAKLYKTDDDVKIKQELTADLVGDYLFTDEKFIKSLTANPNVFQKVFNEIKYLVKIATSGSEAKRKLLEVQRAFERAWADSKTVTRGNAKYSLTEFYVQELSENDVDRYYNTGKTGHVRNKKARAKENGGSAILPTVQDVKSFVRESVKSSTADIKGYAVVPKALSDKILSATNGMTNAENWFLELSSDDLHHAFREHQKAKERGDLDMSIDEFEQLPMLIDGDADILGVERYKDQTKIKLGVKDTNGGNYVVVEMVSSNSQALRMKNAWKVSAEKYSEMQKEKTPSEHKWTSKMPAPSNEKGLADYSISQNSEKSSGLENISENSDIAPTTIGQNSLSSPDDIAPVGKYSNLGIQEDIAPLTMDSVDTMGGVDTNADTDSNQTVSERIAAQIENFRTEMDNDIKHRAAAAEDFDIAIAMAQSEYDALKNKTTRKANDILRRIERLERLKSNVDADFQNRINNLQQRIDKLGTVEYKRAEQRRAKQQTYTEETSELMGDTSTWRDKKLGISYQTNTLRRNLRDIVRDANGNKDIARADRIYDYLQGTYNHNEAKLKQESRNIKKPFADMKINKYESTYAQMLGELRHNPETTLTKSEVDKYLQKHKGKIDTDKVDKIISEARKVYDDLIKRVNEVLREQGMREIAYRKGYFPHFTEDKQSFLGKLFNWKTKNDDIPTDIAGLTETFEPVRSYQSFNKQRTTDKTDYNFKKGFDTYVHGALDWIYHIEDIQKRRAFENEIRYRHSEQGVQNKIDEIKANTEYDADEAQRQIDSVFEESRNPLNNFVTDFRRATQTLAGKKSSADREMEYSTNRKIYSTMTNISNRVSANMVAGSISSALTNFIPITQSWSQVSQWRTIQAMGETIRNYVRDDGTVMKSDFLTNRLLQEENLDKTVWDHIGEKVGGLMEIVDGFTSQVVWRSKYNSNIAKGMTESQAIENADAFAEGLMAGRSRGNMPTIFDSKNPITKMLTAFQLEVANQYGYMFKDVPNDIGKKNILKLVNGYGGMFIGAYVYNALSSALTGRDAAFDPIGILADLMRDLGFGDDDEEEVDVFGAVSNLAENVAQEIPFVGGLLGGGRVPISSALPYDMDFSEAWNDIEGMVTAEDNDKYTKSFIKELLKPVWYVGFPMGGGQIKKTIEGLSMFSDDHPVAGSYTDSGNLRFPVEDTIGNRIQAALFGQYASENARTYFDNDLAPLSEKQTQEYSSLGLSYDDYWAYRDDMSAISKRAEEEGASNEDIIKSKYIASVNSELSDIWSEKEKVQDDAKLTDKMKQAKIAKLDEQYNDLVNERYNSYNKISFDGNYANIGDHYYQWYTPESGESYWRKLDEDQVTKYKVTSAAGNVSYATDGNVHYRLNEGGDWRNISDWTKISDSDLKRQNEVTKKLGITPEEYWSETDISYMPMRNGEYEYAYDYPKQYNIAKAVGGYDTYKKYTTAINDIEGKKNAQGKTISGSRNEPVAQYLESLDIPYGAKIILYRNEFKGDDTYNYDIVRYLESLDNLTYEEKLEILKALGMEVDQNGNIWW